MKKISLLLSCIALAQFLFAQKVATVATNTGINDGLALDGAGHLFGSKYNGSTVNKVVLTDGTVVPHANGFTTPNGAVVDSEGNLYLADDFGGNIYKISPDGAKEVFLSFVNPSDMVFLPGTDTLLVTSYFGNKVSKVAPDGGVTDWSVGGMFNGPVGICLDDNGQVYVGNFTDRKIIRVLPDGSQELLVQAPTNTFLGFIAFSDGHIYGTLINAHQIFRTDLEGNGELFLGSSAGHVDGDASVARFNRPNGIVASQHGDTLYVSEVNGENIRMITNLVGLPSSSHERLGQVSLDVFPNPVAGIATFSFDLSEPDIISLQLVHTSGQIVQSILENQKTPAGFYQLRFETAHIPKGIYHLVLYNENKKALSKKVVLMD